jgi:hypothetical protein
VYGIDRTLGRTERKIGYRRLVQQRASELRRRILQMHRARLTRSSPGSLYGSFLTPML